MIRSPRLAIAAVFVVSRLLFWWAGVRFDAAIVANNFQYIDLALLRDRLAESLYYFHMQPPLMNLMAGWAVKLGGEHFGVLLHALYLAAGLGSALLMHDLMRRFGVDARWALGLTLWYLVSPGSILSENFPMYEYLIGLLLLAGGWVIHRLFARPDHRLAFLFFTLLAALAWLRALYHLYFLVAAAAALAWALRPKARVILLASLLPIASVALLYAKNQAVFGFFGGSSWLPFAIGGTCTTHQLSTEEKDSLIERGLLSPLAKLDAPATVPEYRPFLPGLAATGIPVLDQERKSTGGMNTNHLAYLQIGPQYRAAAQAVFRHAPKAYLRSVLIAWFCYFLPPTDFFQYTTNRVAIRGWDRFYNVVFFGQFFETTRKDLRRLRAQGATLGLLPYTGMFLLLALPLILLGACWVWWRHYRAPRKDPALLALLAFLIVNIVLLMVTTNFLSSFENNRYRSPADPLFVILLGVVGQAVREGLWAKAGHPKD